MSNTNTLTDFAKELIRECAEDRLNVYETYTIVLKGCAKSGYTIEQVGKYLRRVNRATVRRENIYPPLVPPHHHKPPRRTYLPTSIPPPHKQKTSFVVESEESIGGVL